MRVSVIVGLAFIVGFFLLQKGGSAAESHTNVQHGYAESVEPDAEPMGSPNDPYYLACKRALTGCDSGCRACGQVRYFDCCQTGSGAWVPCGPWNCTCPSGCK